MPAPWYAVPRTPSAAAKYKVMWDGGAQIPPATWARAGHVLRGHAWNVQERKQAALSIAGSDVKAIVTSVIPQHRDVGFALRLQHTQRLKAQGDLLFNAADRLFYEADALQCLQA